MLMLPPARPVGAANRAKPRPERPAAEAGDPAGPDRVEPVTPAAGAPDPAERASADERQAAAETPTARTARSYAPLVAQLIATTLGLPQTRSRRRAALAEAAAAYRRARPATAKPRGFA